jgi:hypothetical protein
VERDAATRSGDDLSDARTHLARAHDQHMLEPHESEAKRAAARAA